jgi:CyaY protein
MDESTFGEIGRSELSHIEEQLAEVDPDVVEVASSDGMLTLSLRDGVRVVINTHRAARQIWLAAVASAWHFDPPRPGSDGRWRAGDGSELRATVQRILKERVGLDVAL